MGEAETVLLPLSVVVGVGEGDGEGAARELIELGVSVGAEDMEATMVQEGLTVALPLGEGLCDTQV